MSNPNNTAIDIKKRKLAEELSRPCLNKFKVRRLKDSIKRHVKWTRQPKQKEDIE